MDTPSTSQEDGGRVQQESWGGGGEGFGDGKGGESVAGAKEEHVFTKLLSWGNMAAVKTTCLY